MRILLVVHRAWPYPGGSEIYVQNIAEELLKRNHDVTILAHEHQGWQNGVKMRSDYQQCLGNEAWDLIIVHGADCISQDIVHANAVYINSPVLYLIIKPSESGIAMAGLESHRFLGWSTQEDYDYLKKHKKLNKARYIRHGIKEFQYPLYTKTEIPSFVCAGGFWPHKGMTELAQVFDEINQNGIKAELALFGYSDHEQPKGNGVICFKNADRQTILNTIADSDAYILNSYEEGFGLVLLEAMYAKTPWLSRKTSGAVQLHKKVPESGMLYNGREELKQLLENWIANRDNMRHMFVPKLAHRYVAENMLIKNTVDDIETVLKEIRV